MADQLMNLCPACGKPLLVRYDLQKAAQTMTKAALKTRAASLWRYEEVLPVQRARRHDHAGGRVDTAHWAARLGEQIGCRNTLIKDESLNPTGSFKTPRALHGCQPRL